jgi:hypothetical protein
MALPIADIEKSVYISWFRMKDRLKAMSNSNPTLRIIIKVCLVLLARVLSLLMRP